MTEKINLNFRIFFYNFKNKIRELKNINRTQILKKCNNI
jgi:hypothetical protein